MPTGVLGTDRAMLGNIVLGAGIEETVFERSVTSTITFVSTPQNSNLQSPSNSVNFQQSIVLQVIRNISVNQTITFSELQQPTYEAEVESTIVYDQDCYVVRQYIDTISHTITFVQTIVLNRVAARLIVQSFNPVQTRSLNKTLNISVSNVFNPVETELGNRIKPVNNNIVFDDTIAVDKYKHISHFLEMSNFNNLDVIYSRPIFTIFPVFHTVVRTTKLSKTLAHTFNLNQTIVNFRVKALQQTLALTQTISAFAAKAVNQSFALTQQILVSRAYNQAVAQTLFIEQDVLGNKSQQLSLSSIFAPNQIVQKQKVLSRSISQSLIMTSKAEKTPISKTVSQTLNLVSTATVVKVISRSLSQSVNFQQTIVRTQTRNLLLTHNLIFQNEHNVPFNDLNIPIPNLQIINIQNSDQTLEGAFVLINNGLLFVSGGKLRRRKKYVILQVPSRTIILPAAELNDGENNESILSIRRMMNGDTKTYVKTTNRVKLSYDFVIDTDKAEELEKFIYDFNTDYMSLINWKDEIWRVQLQNNPVSFVTEGRYGNCREKNNVTLDFEGVRLN